MLLVLYIVFGKYPFYNIDIRDYDHDVNVI